jgi:hypothetical protein
MKIATHRWPLLLALLTAAFLGLTGWSVHRASNDVSAVDGDYRRQQSATPVQEPQPAPGR